MILDFTQTAVVGGAIVFPDYAQFTQPKAPADIRETVALIASSTTPGGSLAASPDNPND